MKRHRENFALLYSNKAPQRSSARVPKFYRAVPACSCQVMTVWAIHHAVRNVAMGVNPPCFLSSCRVPKYQEAVVSGGGEAFAVRAVGHTVDRSLVSGKDPCHLGSQIPNPHVAVLARRGKK